MTSYLSFNILNTIASQVVRLALALGCLLGFCLNSFMRDMVAFSTTSLRLKEELVFSFSAIERISSELCLFLPCLQCLPCNANI